MGQVFNGINIMMWRRRNQGHPGSSIAGFSDSYTHLMPGQPPPFAPVCTLKAIFICSSSAFTQIISSYPGIYLKQLVWTALRKESPLAKDRNLFWSSPPSPVLDLPPSRFMRPWQGFVSFFTDRAKTHRPGDKTLTILSTGSTSSIGIFALVALNFSKLLRVVGWIDWSLINLANSWYLA